MKDLVILGAGGNCIDIFDAVLQRAKASLTPSWRVVAFLDDDKRRWGADIHGAPVVGGVDRLVEFPDAQVVCGIGSVRSHRRKPDIVEGLGLPEARFATVLHPSAAVSTFATVGAGAILLSGVHVGSGAQVGRHVFALPQAVISHDVRVGDYAILAGGANVSALVRLGRASYVGANAAVRGDLTIGDGALIGMGAVVLRDVAPGAVVAGVPAHPLNSSGS